MADIILAGSTSGAITIAAPSVSGTNTLTLPVATDTLVGKATTDTLTNKTLTSPVLTTPNLGTPSTLVLTNATGLAAAAMPAGSVLQVVSTTKTDTFTTTSTSPVDVTGLSVSITPSSATSKIFVTGSVCWGIDIGAPYLVGFLLVRNSTSICIADVAGSRSRWTFGAQGVYSSDNTVFAPLNYLDSPATTSATTYKVQVQAETPRTVWINKGGESDGDYAITGRFTSSITVMEIKG